MSLNKLIFQYSKTFLLISYYVDPDLKITYILNNIRNHYAQIVYFNNNFFT